MEGPLGKAKWGDYYGSERFRVEDGEQFFFGNPIDPKTWKRNPKNFIGEHVNGHFLTVAPTRAGKGVSLIIPNLLCYRGSAIVIDPKAELAWITGPRRREFGQVFIVDPWDQVNKLYGSKIGVVEEVAHYNPLSILKVGADDFIDNLAYLADALIITESARDPHWDNSARELVAGLIAYVVENPEFSPYASLGLVRKLLMKPNDVLERAITTAIEKFPDSVAALKLGQFKNPEKGTGIASVISTARTQTGFLDSKEMGRNMEYSDFSFDEFREGGRQTTVYLVLPPHMLITYSRWLRLMVSIAIGALQKGPLDDAEKAEMAAVEAERQSDKTPTKEVVLSDFIPPLSFTPPFKNEPRQVAQPDSIQREYRAEVERWWSQQSLDIRLAAEKLHRNPEDLAKAKSKAYMEWRYAPKPNVVAAPRVPIKLEPLTELPPSLRPSKMAARELSAAEEAKMAALPVLFLLDEFGTIGKLSAISTAFGLAAGVGRGISMWAFVQDMNQLKRHYPEEYETFIGNVTSFICFGIMDQFTVEYVSKMLGTTTIRYKTIAESTSDSTKPIQPDFVDIFFGETGREEPSGRSTSKNTTEHVVAQPLASTDEIRKMHHQKCIVIGHGYDPILCWRVDYYSDETFSRWARPDPKYAKR